MYKSLVFIVLLIGQLNADINNDISIYKQKAKLGDIEANFELGKYYYKKHNLDMAMLYFKRASIYEDNKALYNIATIYANKRYRKYNIKKAFNIYLDLAQNHYPPAQNMIGLYYLHGRFIEKDYKRAMRWFEEAYFVNNYEKAGCSLAYMYVYGKGVLVNLGRAYKLVEKGLKKKIPLCKKIYKEFNLYKYPVDKGFKMGFYKNL